MDNVGRDGTGQHASYWGNGTRCREAGRLASSCRGWVVPRCTTSVMDTHRQCVGWWPSCHIAVSNYSDRSDEHLSPRWQQMCTLNRLLSITQHKAHPQSRHPHPSTFRLPIIDNDTRCHIPPPDAHIAPLCTSAARSRNTRATPDGAQEAGHASGLTQLARWRRRPLPRCQSTRHTSPTGHTRHRGRSAAE